MVLFVSITHLELSRFTFREHIDINIYVKNNCKIYFLVTFIVIFDISYFNYYTRFTPWYMTYFYAFEI